MQYVGRDETAATSPLNPVGWFFPTTLDRTASRMAEEARRIGGINLDMQKFLEGYVFISRLSGESLDNRSVAQYTSDLTMRYAWKASEVVKALNLLVQMRKASQVPDVIWNPSGYIPDQPNVTAPDLATGLTSPVKQATSTLKMLTIVAGLFAAGYILSQTAKVKREFT